MAGSVAGLFLCGMTFDNVQTHAFDLAMGLLIVSAITLVGLLRMTPADQAYEVGHSLGETRGFNAGRRAARPVVVPIRCPECGAPLGQHRRQRSRRIAGQAGDGHNDRSSSG